VSKTLRRKELAEFLLNNKREIHALLNYMWESIEKLYTLFEEIIADRDLDNVHGNYVAIDKCWEEATYPNPTIIFPFGESGFSLDGLYCVFAIDPQMVNELLIAKLMQLARDYPFLHFEIYGGADCFKTFFSGKKQEDIDVVLSQIKQSDEEVLQVEISLPAFAEEEEAEGMLFVAAKKIYYYLSENDLLVKLPDY
jgi:hypothetical protein